MGNKPTSQNSQNFQSMSTEWSGCIQFGNGYRQIDFFDKHFDIPGKIVDIEEIVRNRIVVVVNKVKWYGLRLIICDHRGCGSGEPESGDYEVLKLTDIWGIVEESVAKHIENIKYYFQNSAYADAPWGKLKEEYNIQRKYPPRRLVSLKVRVNGTPSISQRNKVIETLVPGDILIFKRPKLYDHYAVYIGNGNVININAKSCGGGAVKATFHEVCGSGQYDSLSVKVEYKLIEMTPRTLVVKKSFELIEAKDTLYEGAYHLLNKNCEHFARGMVEAGTDKILKNDFKPHGRCKQVNKGAKVSGMALIGVGLLLG